MPTQEFASAQSDISGLFGAYPLNAGDANGVEPGLFNKIHQVFPSEVSMCTSSSVGVKGWCPRY